MADAGRTPRPGRFITLEGGEGAGKSTQRDLLVALLREAGHTVIATREPGGSPGAEQIRRLLVEGGTGRWEPMTEALLHMAARRDHIERVIRPALDRGDWVVSDRFTDSTIAYQGYGHGLGRDAVERLAAAARIDLSPDVTLILDIPVEDGLSRTIGRAGAEDRYERMGQVFHASLRAGFLAIAADDPGRCVVIDAAESLDAVATAIRRAVAARLPEALSA
ncbi:MAG: dTMP kinase [Alphaproteobacteria bacterium]